MSLLWSLVSIAVTIVLAFVYFFRRERTANARIILSGAFLCSATIAILTTFIFQGELWAGQPSHEYTIPDEVDVVEVCTDVGYYDVGYDDELRQDLIHLLAVKQCGFLVWGRDDRYDYWDLSKSSMIPRPAVVTTQVEFYVRGEGEMRTRCAKANRMKVDVECLPIDASNLLGPGPAKRE